jgi:hypothetical protein
MNTLLQVYDDDDGLPASSITWDGVEGKSWWQSDGPIPRAVEVAATREISGSVAGWSGQSLCRDFGWVVLRLRGCGDRVGKFFFAAAEFEHHAWAERYSQASISIYASRASL